jgi:hypothetical protein
MVLAGECDHSLGRTDSKRRTTTFKGVLAMTTPARAALTTEHKASIVLLILLPFAATAQEDEPEFTDDFPVEECTFTPFGGNQFFSLMPGRRTYFDNSACVAEGECEEREDLVVTVTRELKKVWIEDDGERRPIWTRVIVEHEREDGQLKEISRNYFAMCVPSRDVYYFGEDVDIYAGGKVVSHEGAWLAGRHGAEPGIIMPDSAFILGQRYYQELAPGVALDRAEHVDADLEIDLQAGNFDDCVEVSETTPLEPGSDSTKVYCPGVGLVIDSDLEAIAVER